MGIMEESFTIEYKGYEICLNYYDEYCVCYIDGDLVEWNSSFKTLEQAKGYIDNMNKK